MWPTPRFLAGPESPRHNERVRMSPSIQRRGAASVARRSARVAARVVLAVAALSGAACPTRAGCPRGLQITVRAAPDYAAEAARLELLISAGDASFQQFFELGDNLRDGETSLFVDFGSEFADAARGVVEARLYDADRVPLAARRLGFHPTEACAALDLEFGVDAPDAGVPDAGADPPDAGPDAGAEDAGAPDAGSPPADAGAPDAGANDWWNPAWSYRRAVTFPSTGLNTTLTQVPVLLRIGNTVLSRAEADARDLRFVTADGTVWPHEVESVGSEALVWLRAASLGPAGAEPLWLYYGNGAAPTPTDQDAVWSNGFRGVWHLDGLGDATGGGGGGTNVQGVQFADGRVGTGAAFAPALGVDPRITLGGNLPTSLAGGYTLSGWFFADAWGFLYDARIIDRAQNTFTGDGYSFQVGGGRVRFKHGFTGAEGHWESTATDAVALSRWHHVAVVYDAGGGAPAVYVDGSVIAMRAVSTPSGSPEATAGTAALGNHAGGGVALDGMLDEVRVSDAARSAAWIQFSHRTMTQNVFALGAESTP